MAKEYIDTCDDHIKRIIAAVNSGVFEEIHLEIHSLKGTFQTYGLKEDYINLTKDIIHAAKNENINFIQNSYIKVVNIAKQLKEDFIKELNL